MAIVKLPSGKYQAKVQDASRRWISKAFETRREAIAFQTQAKQRLHAGSQLTAAGALTLDEYFEQWRETAQSRASRGWRLTQLRTYRKHLSPLLGFRKREAITPSLVARVLNSMADRGLAEQTRLHVYMLLRKMFGDAIELFRLLTFNPCSKTLKPRVAVKEARHLNLAQSKALLDHTIEKPYGAAIWVQLFLGLRMGEVQALTWEDVDLTEGIVHIRRTYVRMERMFKDHPKGRRQHSHRIPGELLGFLRKARTRVESLFVAPGPTGEMLSYEHYSRSLRRYCRDLSIPVVGTHGLRHSTSELYLADGASRDDLRELFAHSSMTVTERYLHSKGTNLEKVARVIRLFPDASTNLPCGSLNRVDDTEGPVLSSWLPSHS